jgi:serine/threonine protein kinase
LAEGSFGKVWKVKKNREYYALKECSVDQATTENEYKIVQRIITHNLQSIHLVFFYIIVQKKTNNWYLMEYMNQGDYMEMLNYNKTKHQMKLLQCISFQLLDGLYHLHEFYNIIHCDLNPKNILLKKVGNEILFKISDFGSAIFKNDQPPQIGIL